MSCSACGSKTCGRPMPRMTRMPTATAMGVMEPWQQSKDWRDCGSEDTYHPDPRGRAHARGRRKVPYVDSLERWKRQGQRVGGEG